jgi:hypothetical protein
MAQAKTPEHSRMPHDDFKPFDINPLIIKALPSPVPRKFAGHRH